MSICVRCPNGHVVRVKEEYAGKNGLCPHCRAKMHVPLLERPSGELRATGEFVHQDPHHNRAVSVSATPFPTRKKPRLCIGCGNIVSQSFAVCPRCGTRLATYRHLDVRKEGERIVVRFIERQIRDESTIVDIAAEIGSVAELLPRPHLVLDFSGVVGVSSMMLGKLVMLQLRVSKGGGNLRLRNVGPQVREVLATSRLDRTLHVEEQAANAPQTYS
jgi:anti-sigma B factor antagonist